MVNFEQALNDALQPAQRLHYIDYSGLKKTLENAVAGVQLAEVRSLHR